MKFRPKKLYHLMSDLELQNEVVSRTGAYVPMRYPNSADPFGDQAHAEWRTACYNRLLNAPIRSEPEKERDPWEY